jgi:hypothetical protein
VKGKLTEGFRSAGGLCSGACDDGGGGVRTEIGGARGENGCRRSPSFGSSWIDMGGPCEDVEGVRKVGEPSAVSNRGGRKPHRRRPRVQFWRAQGRRTRARLGGRSWHLGGAPAEVSGGGAVVDRRAHSGGARLQAEARQRPRLRCWGGSVGMRWSKGWSRGIRRAGPGISG